MSYKFNAIVHIGEPFTDEGQEWINVSIVTPDHQEHELMVRKEDFIVGKYRIPVEYRVHPACCEHPKGCPDETNTERILREYAEMEASM